MNTILIPTDFSESSKNAMKYAARFAGELHYKKIILYNAYQLPVTEDPALNGPFLYSIEDFKEISESGLKREKAFIQPIINDEMEVETRGDYSLLISGIEELCSQTKIDLIFMGITGKGKLEETLIGSNTVDVARHVTVPVIIVPEASEFKPIKNILFACDFKKVVETTPVEPIKNILDATSANLFVLNIDHNNKAFTSDTPHESLMLDILLKDYHPQYHFIDNADFIEAINQFAINNQVDLIITIPKKHGLFEGLFTTSHTKQLAFHSFLPLMVMHE